MCKFTSGNPLGIVLATHLLVYPLTNTVKKILKETAFIWETYAVGMLNKCNQITKIWERKRQASQQNCCSQQNLHPCLFLSLEANDVKCSDCLINLWLDLLGEEWSFMLLLPLTCCRQPAVITADLPVAGSVCLRLYYHMDVSCSKLPLADGAPWASKPS